MFSLWKNPNLPDSSVISELHLSGPAKTVKYLHDLIIEIETPFDSFEDPEGVVLVYTSPDKTGRSARYITRLYKQ